MLMLLVTYPLLLAFSLKRNLLLHFRLSLHHPSYFRGLKQPVITVVNLNMSSDTQQLLICLNHMTQYVTMGMNYKPADYPIAVLKSFVISCK